MARVSILDTLELPKLQSEYFEKLLPPKAKVNQAHLQHCPISWTPVQHLLYLRYAGYKAKELCVYNSIELRLCDGIASGCTSRGVSTHQQHPSSLMGAQVQRVSSDLDALHTLR